MKEFRYKNATVKVVGEPNLDKIKEATIIFIKSTQRRSKNGFDKTRAINKEQILDRTT